MVSSAVLTLDSTCERTARRNPISTVGIKATEAGSEREEEIDCDQRFHYLDRKHAIRCSR
jgi:hypothetical protein